MQSSTLLNPRSPCGERRDYLIKSGGISQFQSTLPVRGATRFILLSPFTPLISIHAPRAGSDEIDRLIDRPQIDFNPRSPCGERPVACCSTRGFWGISIHAPRAGSDTCIMRRTNIVSNFNPRSPCGERLKAIWIFLMTCSISIHAPRAGSDPCICQKAANTKISIHAPRAGSDVSDHLHGHWRSYFNPRSPCGERRSTTSIWAQSTSISIHAPRAGSDDCADGKRRIRSAFQSTLPVRGATFARLGA